jgi:site-specific recombinase XerD
MHNPDVFYTRTQKEAFGVRITPATVFTEAGQTYIDRKTVNTPNEKVRYLKKRTLEDYGVFKRALDKFFGPMRLDEIDWRQMSKYQILRAAGNGEGYEWAHPAGANLINKELGFLKRIKLLAGTWTQEDECNFHHLQQIQSDIGCALSPDQQQHWLETASGRERWHLVYWYSVLAIQTMARTNELRALRLNDITLHSRIIQVREASSKTLGSLRTIPLTDDALQAVEWLLDRAKSFGAELPQHFLFPWGCQIKDRTRGMTVSALKKPWREVCDASGVKWRPYDTRHTGCTMMASAGVPIHTIMRYAGHVSLKMQLHYTHISEAAALAAASQAFGTQKRKSVRRIGSSSHAGATLQKGTATGGGENGNGNLSVSALIENLRTMGMDANSILQVIQGSTA